MTEGSEVDGESSLKPEPKWLQHPGPWSHRVALDLQLSTLWSILGRRADVSLVSVLGLWSRFQTEFRLNSCSATVSWAAFAASHWSLLIF